MAVGASHSIFFAPLLSDLQRLDLSSASRSLSIIPIEGTRVRRLPSIQSETQTKRSSILGLDDGSLRCAPSVHSSTLRAPVSSLRAPNHSARIPTSNPPKGFGVCPGLNEAGITPLAATLPCIAAPSTLLGNHGPAPSHQTTSQHKARRGIPGPCFAANVIQHRKVLGFASGLTVFFFFFL